MAAELNYGLLFLLGIPSALIFSLAFAFALGQRLDPAMIAMVGVPSALGSSAGLSFAMAASGLPIVPAAITGGTLLAIFGGAFGVAARNAALRPHPADLTG